jgi:protein-tyrosine phosphatase
VPARVDGTLLVVCAANVCRSPYAAFLLAQELPDAVVRSAGITARAGDALCGFTRERIAALPAGEAFAGAHVTTRLDAAAVAAADLILTASEAERSAVAVMDPAARSRAFTLVEASFSAAALAPSESGDTSLAALAARMHGQRGLVAMPPVRRRHRLSPFRSTHGIAIPDAHIGDTRKHDEVYRAITDAVSRFARALDPALSERDGSR